LSPDADGDEASVAAVGLLRGREDGLRAEDVVLVVGRVPARVAAVGLGFVDLGRDGFVEEQLAGEDFLVADEDLGVDVDRPSPVPAGVDREQLGECLRRWLSARP
jgi:hypothetical protein